MADHSKPLVTSTYANFVTELDGRFDDLALGLDPATTTPTNLPTGAIRWNSASSKWEKWSGTAWADLTASYNINLSGPLSLTANSASDALRITQTGAGNALLVEDSSNPDSTPFVVSGTGDVGIGKTSPAYKLDVVGTASVSSNMLIGGTLAVTGVTTFSSNPVYSAGTANGVVYLNGSKVATTGSALTFDGTNLGVGTASTGGWKQRIVSAGNQTLYLTNSSGLGTRLYMEDTGFAAEIEQNSGNLLFKPGTVEGMRLTSTGLGIGTSSPVSGYKLTVSGAAVFGSSGVDGTFNTVESYNINGYGTAYQNLIKSSVSVDLANSGISWHLANGANTTSEVMRLQGGNLGLGVTPSAWYSGNNSRALEFNNGAIYSFANTPEFNLGMNFYLNSGGSWIYKANGVSTRYSQQSGQHQWLIAPSGTAGNAISFTQAMTLDASGSLGIGTSSPNARLQVYQNSANLPSVIRVTNGSSGNNFDYAALAVVAPGISGGVVAWGTGSLRGPSMYIGSDVAVPLIFGTTDIERMRIDSSGNVGIGTSSPATKLEVAKAGLTSVTGATLGNVSIRDTSGVLNRFATLDFVASVVGDTPIARISSETTSSGTYLNFGTSNHYCLSITNIALTLNPPVDVGIGTLSINRTAVTAPAATDGNVFSGTYTPTITNGTNVSGSTATVNRYTRVGNQVTIHGTITLTFTAANTNSNVRMNFPIASSITSTTQGRLTGTSHTLTNRDIISGLVNVTNNDFDIRCYPSDTGNIAFQYIAMYEVA